MRNTADSRFWTITPSNGEMDAWLYHSDSVSLPPGAITGRIVCRATGVCTAIFLFVAITITGFHLLKMYQIVKFDRFALQSLALAKRHIHQEEGPSMYRVQSSQAN